MKDDVDFFIVNDTLYALDLEGTQVVLEPRSIAIVLNVLVDDPVDSKTTFEIIAPSGEHAWLTVYSVWTDHYLTRFP